MAIVGSILLFLLVLSIVVCLHEFGHFYFAKKAGILCHEFAFGMGPRIISKKIGETTFSIRAVPFGGFVSMAGEEIEAALVKKGEKVQLRLDKDGFVDRIILDSRNTEYRDLPVETVEIIDLLGKDMAPLYINNHPVRRDAYYVMGKKELQIAPYERNFNSKTKMQRFLTTVGGPMMNVILAFVVLLSIYLFFGVANYGSTKIGTVPEGSPASEYLQAGDVIISINGVNVTRWYDSEGLEQSVVSILSTPSAGGYVFSYSRGANDIVYVTPAVFPVYSFYGLGFQSDPEAAELIIGAILLEPLQGVLLPGDKIISINGESFANWAELIVYAKAYTSGSSSEEPAQIIVERDGVILEAIEFTAYGEDSLVAMGVPIFTQTVGVAPSSHFNLFQSFENAFVQLGSYSTMIFTTLKQLFFSDQILVSDLSGFVGIYQFTANAASQGLRVFLSWIALLSINLGILNLLPIPALDGGRIMFIGYEAVTGKKPNQKVENILHTLVFILLIGLMLFVTYNDIMRLLGL
jgi:regulator of sigma E protease